MRILHLFSNWKWTGPAEPALNLAWMSKRRHQVVFAGGAAPPHQPNHVRLKAEERHVEFWDGLELSKHFKVGANWTDVRRLTKLLQREKFDIVHCHLPNDHLVGSIAVRRAKSDARLIRTCYEGDGPEDLFRVRAAFRVATDGLITISEQGKQNALEGFRLRDERIEVVPGGVDLERFDAERFDRAAARAELELPEYAFVVGIVARIQPRRRFDVFLEAVKLLQDRLPNLRVLVVGRGTHMEEVAVQPVERLGLQNVVRFPGYRVGEYYVKLLRAFDAGVYLVPGTDGSCRTVREMMAMGIPVVAAERGALPEIIENEKTGLVLEDTPENLANALHALSQDADRRNSLGTAAREKARAEYSLEQQVSRVESFYEEIRGLKPRRGRQ
ncbi:MAG: glycosyltransferase family 4 protein [Planctomycetota bacterium]